MTQLAETDKMSHALDEARQRVAALEAERENLLAENSARRQLLASILENAPVGVAILRAPDFAIELANPALQAIWPEVQAGQTLSEAAPVLADQVIPTLRRLLETGEPYRAAELPFTIRRVPGAPEERVFFTFSAVPLRGAAGRPDAVLALLLEMTGLVRERERAEQQAEAARQCDAERRGVLDAITEAVFVIDAEGRIVRVNPGAVRLVGPAAAQDFLTDMMGTMGEHPMRHADGSPLRPEENVLARALAGEDVARELRVGPSPQLGRDVYLRVSGLPIRDVEGEVSGAVVVYEDVSELVEHDRHKDEFISAAAHELKTPVTVMKGYAQTLLRAGAQMPPEAAKALRAIDRGADRITRIVDDLLLISRLRLGELQLSAETLDLSALAATMVERVDRATPRHKVRLIAPQPVRVRADRSRLEQVLTQLLDNAVKYSPRGGEVDVAVAVRDDQAVVAVRDRGVGIPKEKQARIFERFYSAHTGTPYDFGGLGVGLYLSREVIVRMGGTMWFESEEGEGSTFYFSLPLAA